MLVEYGGEIRNYEGVFEGKNFGPFTEQLQTMSMSNIYDMISQVNTMHGLRVEPKPKMDDVKKHRKRDKDGKHLTVEQHQEQKIKKRAEKYTKAIMEGEDEYFRQVDKLTKKADKMCREG